MATKLTSRSSNEEIINAYNASVDTYNRLLEEYSTQVNKTYLKPSAHITYLSYRLTKKSYIEDIECLDRSIERLSANVAHNKEVLAMRQTEETKKVIEGLESMRDRLSESVAEAIESTTKKANEVIKNTLGNEWQIRYRFTNDGWFDIIRVVDGKTKFGEDISMYVNIYNEDNKVQFNMSTSGAFAAGTTMAERYVALATLLQSKLAQSMLLSIAEEQENLRKDKENQMRTIDKELRKYELY